MMPRVTPFAMPTDPAPPPTCVYCGKASSLEQLRPYGVDGALSCFGCAMKPENKATTEAAFKTQLDSAGPTPVLDPAGVGPRAATKEEIRSVGERVATAAEIDRRRSRRGR